MHLFLTPPILYAYLFVLKILFIFYCYNLKTKVLLGLLKNKLYYLHKLLINDVASL